MKISGVEGILKVAILKALSPSEVRDRERYPVSLKLNSIRPLTLCFAKVDASGVKGIGDCSILCEFILNHASPDHDVGTSNRSSSDS